LALRPSIHCRRRRSMPSKIMARCRERREG
jgi:hypothetical protein